MIFSILVLFILLTRQQKHELPNTSYKASSLHTSTILHVFRICLRSYTIHSKAVYHLIWKHLEVCGVCRRFLSSICCHRRQILTTLLQQIDCHVACINFSRNNVALKIVPCNITFSGAGEWDRQKNGCEGIWEVTYEEQIHCPAYDEHIRSPDEQIHCPRTSLLDTHVGLINSTSVMSRVILE